MAGEWTRRDFVRTTAAAMAGAATPQGISAAEPVCGWTLENDVVCWRIGLNGRSQQFVDKRVGKDYLASPAPIATVRKAGRIYPVSAAGLAQERLTLQFGEAAVDVVLRLASLKQHLTLEVESVTGDGVEELVFADIPLALQGAVEEPFAACALALNLQTNVVELPRPASRLRAVCYSRFGLKGAKVALVAGPRESMRDGLREAVAAAPWLPHSPLGGPWALGQPINQGSYLFNFDGITEKNVDAWIAVARSLGMTQIDFHGGHTFRFGDCRPNPALYPQGFASLKPVLDKLHAAGIAAGLHTYAFFLAKDCPWVTPVPDPRLAADATFTLAEALPATGSAVPVVESTAKVSAITGFFVRNSVTLRIDEELITYTAASREPPYAFTGCQRGACGTKPAAHAKGAKVQHLKECFGLFVPDPHSTLFGEVAGCTAEAFNRCGFDMMYLDALDGEDILGGAEHAWHYGSRFVYEIWRRLQKPALMEMSTFHHHLWCVRSRYCAWDHPNRAYKRFIDLHCADNENTRRMFLPGELGWWALKSWTGPQAEPTFADDIEYLMTKALATDTGLALMGIDPSTAQRIPALPRLATIIKRYEDLRHSKQIPEPIKARLREPGKEFSLVHGPEGWQFLPTAHARHKVESAEPWSSAWRVKNAFGRQPLRVRIEALMAAGPYPAPGNVVVADFHEGEFPLRAAQTGVTAELAASHAQVKSDGVSGCLTAKNARPGPAGAWAQCGKTFSPPIDLHGHQALGLWVYGDGLGELLNIQLRSPQHVVAAIGEHYIPIDFTGWRYFELIEPEGTRYADYQWPYGDIYSIYRESVHYSQVETLSVWLNHLPPGKQVTCYLSPIKAVPVVAGKLINPSLTLDGVTLRFPVEIDSGSYLEFNGPTDCKLYGPQGQLVREVRPEGPVPWVVPGENQVQFHATAPAGIAPRANVTISTQGEPLRG